MNGNTQTQCVTKDKNWKNVYERRGDYEKMEKLLEDTNATSVDNETTWERKISSNIESKNNNDSNSWSLEKIKTK